MISKAVRPCITAINASNEMPRRCAHHFHNRRRRGVESTRVPSRSKRIARQASVLELPISRIVMSDAAARWGRGSRACYAGEKYFSAICLTVRKLRIVKGRAMILSKGAVE